MGGRNDIGGVVRRLWAVGGREETVLKKLSGPRVCMCLVEQAARIMEER